MKKIGEYTMRGQVAETVAGFSEKIGNLFDGRFDTGYRVVEFVIAGVEGATADDYSAKLSTEATGTRNWNWGDNREIAWASTNVGASGVRENHFSLVDPDNLTIEELFIDCLTPGTGTLNYFIRLEKYSFSDWRGALAMVRNSSQDV